MLKFTIFLTINLKRLSRADVTTLFRRSIFKNVRVFVGLNGRKYSRVMFKRLNSSSSTTHVTGSMCSGNSNFADAAGSTNWRLENSFQESKKKV